MKFRYYLRVDLVKSKFGVAVLEGREFLYHQTIDNHAITIKAFLKSLKSR